MSREESPMPTSNVGTLGTLFLVGRKTGIDVQSFPIDAERVTIGRDYDCDIRLYFSDVSKLHCEIIFDLLTNQASLHVHGGNGITYTSSSGNSSHQIPPSVLPLSTKDTFMLRKKVFRFEYATEESLTSGGYFSPAPQTFQSPVKSVRRRASHRLSLVPSGKDFVAHSPAKGRRQSILENRPSKLSQAVEEENQPEEEEADEELVDVVEGDGGDRIYLEMKEEQLTVQPHNQLFNNAFMTPQQKKKPLIRNTSAVPRTRKLPPISTSDDNAEHQPAKTPRSIPLPPSAETPYNVSQTPSRVPPKVAMTTPKGDASLRKALLLRSARKVWQDTRSPGIDGAIERGDVEVRRKSLSPKVRTPKKSLTPMPSPPQDEESEEEEEEEVHVAEKEGATEQGGLQWVHEDGTVDKNVSFESSNSAEDSFEADVSLDIAGEFIIDFGQTEIEVEHGEEVEVEAVQEVQDDIEYEDPTENQLDEREDEVMEDDFAEEEGDEVAEMAPALPGTPAAARALSKFYTPQPRRAMGQPRRSLADISGPAVRFKPVSESSDLAMKQDPMPRTPGTMGPPSRRKQREQTPEDETEQVEDVKPTPAKTPSTAAMRAEAKRRRESLATPRALPLPPASGFRTISRDIPGLNLMATPSHPALAPTSPPGHDNDDVPPTPMNDIRRRLSMLRRDNKPGNERRATVGYKLPSTPMNRLTTNMTANHTIAAGARKLAPIPITPTVEPIRGTDSEVSSLQQTPTIPGPAPPTTVSLNDILPQRLEEQRLSNMHVESSDSIEVDVEQSVATPSYKGLKEMLHAPLPPKTPHFGGLKDMFNTSNITAAQPPRTPAFDGMRQLLSDPAKVPKTPSFLGIRDMYAERKASSTPGMEGVADMYEAFEGEEHAQEQEVGVAVSSPVSKVSRGKGSRSAASRRKTPAPVEQPMITAEMNAPQDQAISSAPSKSRSVASSRSASSRTRTAPVIKEEEQLPQTQIPVKRGRAAKSAVTQSEESSAAPAPAPAKTTRTRKATSEVPEATTSRSTIEVIESSEQDPPSKRSARSRSTRTQAEVTPIAEEKPSNPSRATSSRAKKVETAEPVVLGDLDDQTRLSHEKATTKGKGKTIKAINASTSASEVSAPAKRTVKKVKEAEGDKENEPVEKKVPAKRSASAKVKDTVTPVSERATTRATRSRK